MFAHWPLMDVIFSLGETTTDKVGKRCNVEVSPHKVRRTFATWVWKSGIDVHTLRDLMGHADLTTLPAYLGIDADDLQRAHVQHGPVDHIE